MNLSLSTSFRPFVLLLLPMLFACSQTASTVVEEPVFTEAVLSDDLLDGEKVYETANYKAVPVGGLDLLKKEMKYPDLAKRAGVEGTVFVPFIVDKEGNPHGVLVGRGIGAGCDQEVVRVLRSMTFKAATVDGQPVNSHYSLSVTFSLKGRASIEIVEN